MKLEDSDLLGPGNIDLSVVVVTAGFEWTMVKAGLTSVRTACMATNRSWEIIVIENPGSDEFHENLVQEFPEIVLLRFPTKVGFCTSNNAGFRVSSGRYILQLNDDTIVDPCALTIMLDFLEAHPEVGACGPLLLNPDGSVQHGISAAFPRFIDHIFMLLGINRIFPRNPFVRQFFLIDDPLDVAREIDQPAGAALLYRRVVLNEVGLLDEDYTYAFDDVDICMRIKEVGWRIYRIPQAKIVHYGTFSINRQPSAEKFDHWFAGMLFFYQKRKPHLATSFKVLMIVSFVLRMPRIIFVCLFGSPESRRHWRGAARTYLRYLWLMVTHLFTPLPPRDKSNLPKAVLVNLPSSRVATVS